MADNHSDQIIYLHGDLDLKIHSARDLPNMDFIYSALRSCLSACGPSRAPVATRDLDHHSHKPIITSDPYVTVSLDGTTVARTKVIRNSEDPEWDETFKIPLAHPVSQVDFQVKDNDVFGAQLIGTVSIPAQRIKSGEAINDWFAVIGPSKKPPKPDSALHLEMKFTPFGDNPLYKHGIAGDPEHLGVRNTYFRLRRGGSVTLYQDAHTPDGLLPEIELEKGRIFKHEKCWEDICQAILEARHLIYIVGWSVSHKVKLVREPSRKFPESGEQSLGDLLRYKSQEGVRVLLLVWDDRTSDNRFFSPTEGVMQTHDEETRKFFKHSSVVCVLSPRYASSKLSFVKQRVVGTLFTHHQKCVLVDTLAPESKRKITAFLGGLDLCDGRYDTPEHRLFRDLDSIFKDDFYNPTFPTKTKGPRQPWHDLHCKIEGPAAYDVLKNFEQRWKQATKWSFGQRIIKTAQWHDDALLKLERVSWILNPSTFDPNDDSTVQVCKEDDHENWHVQVFRSIDSGSVRKFRKDVHRVEKQNLVRAKHLLIDKSIQTGYIQAIRCAQHFIYVENQYFLGSSYGWPSYKNAGADNLIPMELALKIASKIRAKERFAVYIVIPMWPEGVPTAASIQEILFWQGQTMQMMYEIIAQVLKSMQLENSHPCDYLNFYCLGNREEFPNEMPKPSSQPSNNSDAASASQKYGRFMIYVHSKGMIVDDEYVILGSANINQRSLDGVRDTEIAMGAYQPHHTWAAKKKHPHGQIYGYRMSLWAEHLGMLDDRFKEPHSLDCVRCVNTMAEENWNRFTAEEVTPMPGHLLKYPIQVYDDGKVGPLPGYDTFPDVGGKVLGSCSNTLPDALTT